MPLLSLGFFLGAVVTKTVRTLQPRLAIGVRWGSRDAPANRGDFIEQEPQSPLGTMPDSLETVEYTGDAELAAVLANPDVSKSAEEEDEEDTDEESIRGVSASPAENLGHSMTPDMVKPADVREPVVVSPPPMAPCVSPKTDESSLTRVKEYPQRYVCRFPYECRNGAMNATLQATLHLDVVRERLIKHTVESLTRSSSMPPVFAELLLTAVRNPGRRFITTEMSRVLLELCRVVPSLRLLEENYAEDFAQPLLSWYDQCGIKTSLKITFVSRCVKCDYTSSNALTLDGMYYLPPANEEEAIESLVKYVSQDRRGKCVQCGSATAIRQFWSCPDILTFVLPTDDVKDLRKNVKPSEFIKINVDENRTQSYKLSSVVCHRENDNLNRSLWTYLFCGDITIQVNDRHISVTDSGRPEEVYTDGQIYFYEICHGPQLDLDRKAK